MNIDNMKDLASIVESLVIMLTLMIAAYQIFRERKLRAFQLYQSLAEKYSELLWHSKDDADLDNAWKPLSPNLKNDIDFALKNKKEINWPVWHSIETKEKKIYRFSRAGLEIFEQAYLGRGQGWAEKEIWEKWKIWMKDWENTIPMTKYVFEECKSWFTKSFVEFWEKEIREESEG